MALKSFKEYLNEEENIQEALPLLAIAGKALAGVGARLGISGAVSAARTALPGAVNSLKTAYQTGGISRAARVARVGTYRALGGMGVKNPAGLMKTVGGMAKQAGASILAGNKTGDKTKEQGVEKEAPPRESGGSVQMAAPPMTPLERPSVPTSSEGRSVHGSKLGNFAAPQSAFYKALQGGR